MAHVSSPINYPPSSSPPVFTENRKRALLDASHGFPAKRHIRSPPPAPRVSDLHEEHDRPTGPPVFKIPGYLKPTGPFLEDDDDDEDVLGLNEDGAPIGQSLPSPIAQLPQERSEGSAAEATPAAHCLRTSQGKLIRVGLKPLPELIPFEKLVGARSIAEPGKARKSFYGVDIHSLLDQAAQVKARDKPNRTCEERPLQISKDEKRESRRRRHLLWTEKYRARKYTDLVGDERTHRDVLRWLKGWDPIVFPEIHRTRPVRKLPENEEESRAHRKILMITGPPGLGKTTLAHVCARQAGYEVLEINASDERSKDVVKGKIKDCVGTDNVRGAGSKNSDGITNKPARPFCVVIDEVDGVVSGNSSGGGEGGFIKALIDLITLDQKNQKPALSATSGNLARTKNKSEKFRLLRPIILICNDVYHPSLRPLRSTSLAEIVHIRKPPLDKVVSRLKVVLDKEGVACDNDGVRKLCETTWGISDRREARQQSNGAGEGDMRSILVTGEWLASKLRTSKAGEARLSKRWVEENMMNDSLNNNEFSRGLGRGGIKEAVDRVFQEGAGFAKSDLAKAYTEAETEGGMGSRGVSETAKRAATSKLQEIIDTSGDSDRIITDCFSHYPSHPFQDDTFLSKPNAACEWLLFHDCLSSKVHTGQDWELGPYLSQSILGFHHLFASSSRQVQFNDHSRSANDGEEEPLPFSGPRAEYDASESLKQHKSTLTSLQSSLSIALLRSFRSLEDISTDLIPHTMKLLTPNVKPVVVGGSGEQRGVVSIRKESEKNMVQRAAKVMGAVGVTFERIRVETGSLGGASSYVYRMDP